MNERSCQFGDRAHLAGIVTEPEPPAPSPSGALVLVSAGLVPKSGPFRLYAELARRLSRDGVVTLRFDLQGIGESRLVHTGVALKPRTLQDVRAAIDWLVERYDVPNVVLGGLCSGAEDSFRSAELDARVNGVVMVDPFAYRTAGFFPRHLLYRVLRRTRRTLGLYRPSVRARGGAERAEGRIVRYEYMRREESSRILRTLIGRRAHVHFVYTGGAREVFNHEGQLAAMFDDIDFDGRVTIDHLARLEHTQLLAADRRCLVEAVARRLRWMSDEPGAEADDTVRTQERQSGWVERQQAQP